MFLGDEAAPIGVPGQAFTAWLSVFLKSRLERISNSQQSLS